MLSATTCNSLAEAQARKKEESRAQTEQDQKTDDALNDRNDQQFDLSDALIAILSITALTQLWPLYWASLVPTVLGLLMGVAGLTSLPIHPDAVMKLLS